VLSAGSASFRNNSLSNTFNSNPAADRRTFYL
jgi:hypothetical protein